ncbi:MAG: hypothetical protein KC572_11035 [Gammaproteobacteria bacterium]|nr:hypothetical protein [Gammaproteobacteria bacterium]
MRFTGIATIAMLLSFLLGGCGPEEVVERAEVIRPVKMITIGAATGNETLEISGSVHAAQSIVVPVFYSIFYRA